MRIKSLKLYHYPLTRSVRAKWMLHETVGADFETEIVAVIKGAMLTPEMLAKNPNHNLPMLDITWDDGSVQTMLESGAMVAFLADAFPEKHLAPPPDMTRHRADYLQMLHFGASWMDMALWQIRLHQDLLPDRLKQTAIAELNIKKIANEMAPQLEARLTTHEYICGDAFTAADCITGHNVRWAQSYRLCLSDPLKDYIRRLSQRPAFQAAYADADQFGK